MYKVLIVDDEPTVLQQVRQLLIGLGYTSGFITRGELLLERLEAETFDLVLLDVYMPQIDGLNLLQQIRRCPQHRNLPIIMLTADTNEALMEQCLEAGASDFLNKPIQEANLRARLKTAIALSQQINEVERQRELLREANDELERRVRQRTRALEATNNQLALEIEHHQLTAKELERAKLIAQAANRVKTEFLANTSHELRTPLNIIQGMTDLLLETPLNETQRQYVQLLCKAEKNLLNLINDILDFSRLETGNLELQELDLEIREILAGVCQMMEPKMRQKSLRLSWKVAPDVPEKWLGDSKRLEQILLNLLDNALKFTSQGEIRVEVSLDPEYTPLDPQRMRCCVHDTGIGIPIEKQEMIFERFSQADSSITRQYGGSGLGLAIVQHLVERMHGRIWVESQEGQGSTFCFTTQFQPWPPPQVLHLTKKAPQ